MKKISLLLAFVAFSATASFAQTTTTDVNVRDNGTVKATTTNDATGTTTVQKTGKTNTGAALEATGDAAGNVAKKGGRAVKSGAKKTGRAVKRGAQKTSGTVKRGAEKMEAKTE